MEVGPAETTLKESCQGTPFHLPGQLSAATELVCLALSRCLSLHTCTRGKRLGSPRLRPTLQRQKPVAHLPLRFGAHENEFFKVGVRVQQ